MSLMRSTLISLFCYLLTFTGYAQLNGIGQWRDHLPYSDCIGVKEVGTRIYCATPFSIFYFDKSDNSVQRVNKINGLSDIGISTINYNKDFHTLVIAYTNANIDLIKNNTIINISDIKRSSILGDKTINDIYFDGPYAYLSCGFGIVVLDVDKEEIHDTYYIGANGGQVKVLGFTKSDNDTLYAATQSGIYLAYAKSTNLANYQSWKKDLRLNGFVPYDHIINFGGQVIVSRFFAVTSTDSLYRLSNGHWNSWKLPYNNPVEHLEVCSGKLIVTLNYFVWFYDADFNHAGGVFDYNGGGLTPTDCILDNAGYTWLSDASAGLVYFDQAGNFNAVGISGPLTNLVFAMTAYGDDVYVVPGGREPGYTPNGYFAQIYHFNNTSWANLTRSSDPALANAGDLCTISVDPGDPKRIYSGSFGRGLLELYNDKVVDRFTTGNSTLKNHNQSDTADVRVGGTAFDSQGNLWVVNSHNNWCISRFCRTCSQQWTGYDIPKISNDDLGALMIDNSDQKWVIMRIGQGVTGSILVIKENPDNPADVSSTLLTSNPGSGNIPGQTVFAMATDKNGQVWVGTEKGIGVFYNPENIFVAGQNYDAQQILVQQGAYVQYLMENEKVTAIAVDGGNRKWIGTEGGGIYLFSEDGTKQIYHFTTDNSPLFSDNIIAIAINPVTGEVFIGTDRGLLSFRGTSTEGTDKFSGVYAYPNPVKEDYEGMIGIKGLVTNAQVRITDIEGNLIFSTIAEGGEAVWDGRNFNGRKARTGVYLVHAGNAKGSEKIVTKILIIH